ncbi:hypothetical protein J132_01143, partial [Termitomyces sp. J132]
LVLHYKDHSEQATFAVTSLGKQDIILGFTWLCKHNSEIDWTKSEVKMSLCPHCCTTCAEEAHKLHRTKVCEHAAMCACHAGHLPYVDLDLLYPPLWHSLLERPSTRMSKVLGVNLKKKRKAKEHPPALQTQSLQMKPLR